MHATHYALLPLYVTQRTVNQRMLCRACYDDLQCVLPQQGKSAERRAKAREEIEYTEEILVTCADLEVHLL